MPNWLVSGAGMTAFNGVYVEDGVYGGKPAYKHDSTHWLYWLNDSVWALGSTPGEAPPGYVGSGSNLPANPWEVVVGDSPAPVVSSAALSLIVTFPTSYDDIIYDGPLPVWFTWSGFEGVIADFGTVYFRAWMSGPFATTYSSLAEGESHVDLDIGLYNEETRPYTSGVVVIAYVLVDEYPVVLASDIGFFTAGLKAGPSGDLSIDALAIDHGIGQSIGASDEECRVYGTVSGTNLDYITYALSLNGTQIQTYRDNSPSLGDFEHWFSGLSLAAGDILSVVVRAYDLGGDYRQAYAAADVAGYKTVTLVIGDDAGEFGSWSLIDVEDVLDNLKLESQGTFYKSSGTINLVHDSGYTNTVWDLLTFSGVTPTGTAISVKVRVADTEAGLASATYYPAAGISTSGYDLSSISGLPAGRWIEVQSTLSTSDPTVTPTLLSLEVFYSAPPSGASSKTWALDADFNGYESLTDIVVADDTVVLDGTTVTAYDSLGVFILRLDPGTYVNWQTVSWSGTFPGGSGFSVRTRSYFDLAEVEDAVWSAPITSSGSAITSDNGFYLDVEVTLTGTTTTPELDSLTITFDKEVNAATKYVYTTEFTLPDVVGSLLIAANSQGQEPDCTVQYRYSVDGDTDWGDMRAIKPSQIMRVLTASYLSGTDLRVAARLTSYSLTEKAILDELLLMFSCEDGRLLQIM